MFLCTPGIRQLQLMLLKVSLVLGVEIHVNVEFVKLVEPPAEQNGDSKSVLTECVEWAGLKRECSADMAE